MLDIKKRQPESFLKRPPPPKSQKRKGGQERLEVGEAVGAAWQGH